MASLSIDSELMTNYVSTVPIPAGSHQVAVLDEQRMPMVFCLSNDLASPQLQVFRRDSQGRSQLLDLHNLIGLPDAIRVQTFHVQQSWDLTLYVAVAYTQSLSPSSSKLHLLKPFRPENLKEGSGDIKLATVPGDTVFGIVDQIHMAPFSGVHRNLIYPDVFLIHKQLDLTSSWGSDITHIHVEPQYQKWFATQELSTPENAAEVLAVAPAVSVYGQGLYVLYITQGVTKIFARYLRPDRHASDGAMTTKLVNVVCPTGARCIASVLDNKGYTGLLVAAPDGIRYLNTAETTSGGKPGRLILSTDMHQDIRQLFVAQDQNDVTIWFRNVKGELGYTRTKADSLAEATQTGVSSMLLPANLSSAFAPIVTAPSEITGNSVRQMLISNDRQGNLMLIEQSDDVGLWRKTPFYKPDDSRATELKSYTVTVKVMDENGNALSDGSVRISASSTVSIILNGQNKLLTTVPTWFDCDDSGSLDFIIPTDSLGAQALCFEQIRSKTGEILKFAEQRYDPCRKPMTMLAKKLSEADTPEKFALLRTQSGEPLFDPSVSNDMETIKGAHACLTTVTRAYGDATQLANLSSRIASTASEALHATERFLMDGWLWMKEMAHTVTEWFVDVASGVWRFICKIGGMIKEFVLDTVEKICEAATWIWEKLKVGWNTLVDLVGFIFNWEEILATKNAIASTITAALEYGVSKLDQASSKVDEFCSNLEKRIDGLDPFITVSNPRVDSATKDPSSGGDTKIREAASSTATNWVSERLKNGGAQSATNADTKEGPSQAATDLLSGEPLKRAWTKLNDSMETLKNDIANLHAGMWPAESIIEISKDLPKVGIAIIRGVLVSLLEVFAKLVSSLNDFGSAKVNLNVLSWLYGEKTGGRELTSFDAIALILAIPMTVLSKVITGKAPPTFGGDMSLDLITRLFEGDKTLRDEVKTDWAVFRAELVMGLTSTTTLYGTVKLFYHLGSLGADKGVVDILKGQTRVVGVGSFFGFCGIIYDMIAALVAIPDEGVPGAECRKYISNICVLRVVYHTVAHFANVDIATGKGILLLDLLTMVVNLSLSIAVGVAEHNAANTWDDYNPNATNAGLVTAGYNAVAGFAYFAAAFFRETNPLISGSGATIMFGAALSAVVTSGLCFRLRYDAQQRPSLTSPPIL